MEILKHKRTKYGYTLLELLVVVALIAIVLAVGIPSLQTIINTKEKKELMEFKRDIIFARNSAVVENKIFILELNNTNNSYRISKVDKTAKIVKDVKFSNGVKLNKNNFNSCVNFLPTGAPSDAGTISMTNRKKQKIEITITPATGKVNLYIKDK